MSEVKQSTQDWYKQRNTYRLAVLQNAWALCNVCGGKLYEFDGTEDKGVPCPKPLPMKNGRTGCGYD